MNRLLALAFACLAGFKFVAVLGEGSNVLAASVYAAMFGSPQLLWVLLCRKPLRTGPQRRTALLVAAAFLGTSVYFGSFPGTQPPRWGGEGHFEVPAAFVVEWVISLAGAIVLYVQGKAGIAAKY